jgi:hypothetical protein
MKKPILATTFLLLFGVAHAVDFPNMPPLKEGLWKIRMIDNTPGQKSTDNTYTLCRNHAYDEKGRQLAQKFLTACSTTSDVKSGNSRTVVISCKIGGSTVVTRSTLTGLSDTHFHTESSATYTPPLYGQSQSSMIQEQTYLGACPANMQPGDRQLADGTIEHHR